MRGCPAWAKISRMPKRQTSVAWLVEKRNSRLAATKLPSCAKAQKKDGEWELQASLFQVHLFLDPFQICLLWYRKILSDTAMVWKNHSKLHLGHFHMDPHHIYIPWGYLGIQSSPHASIVLRPIRLWECDWKPCHTSLEFQGKSRGHQKCLMVLTPLLRSRFSPKPLQNDQNEPVILQLRTAPLCAALGLWSSPCLSKPAMAQAQLGELLAQPFSSGLTCGTTHRF